MNHYLCLMDKKEQFESLRVELNRTKNWPLVYMFKFIFPADSKKQALVESKFSDDSVISQNTSANGNTSASPLKKSCWMPIPLSTNTLKSAKSRV
ncbi:MAG: hypothetical protein IPI10_15420 [Bacteroidetes bacterium]|nr:hypothetical protein [Bacteroidota bacterium]